MLMLNFHMAFSLGLIALAFGAAILIWSKAHESVGTSLAKLIGYIIIIASVLNISCTAYYAVKYRLEGYFDKPYPTMMQGRMMSGKNMQMMKYNGMQDKMMPDQGQMDSSKMPNSTTQEHMMKDNGMQGKMDSTK